MAADGAWPRHTAEPEDERAQRTLAELRALVARLEARLAAPEPEPLGAEAVAQLTGALEALGRRLDGAQTDAAGRFADLGAKLSALAARIERQASDAAELAARLDAAERRMAERLAAALAERDRPPVPPTRAAPEPAPIRLVLLAASSLAALSVAAALALVIAKPEILPEGLPPPFASLAPLPLRPSLGPPAKPLQRAAGTAATPSGQPADSYPAVAQALERGEAEALPRLEGLAERGDPSAQLHLARLYEAGAPGIAKDLGSARAWTRKAAEAGDRVAMHNLALFLLNGDGGPRDAVGAVRWFRRAAGQGVIDSQHNLGLLYLNGRGVERNLREAYRWFSIAANAGDLESREKMVELEARLAPAERAALDREATAFQPGAVPSSDAGVIVPPAATVAETQALLARSGYYVGPVDGAASPALKVAAAAYLRDHPAGP